MLIEDMLKRVGGAQMQKIFKSLNFLEKSFYRHSQKNRKFTPFITIQLMKIDRLHFQGDFLFYFLVSEDSYSLLGSAPLILLQYNNCLISPLIIFVNF